jgi:hypothetical protein
MNLQIIALGLIRAIRRVREGASANSTRICIPSEPRLASLQSAYDAIVNPRGESASPDAMSACKVQVRHKFIFEEFVARSSERRRIPARGTPVSRE